jgi:hypothetical protein
MQVAGGTAPPLSGLSEDLKEKMNKAIPQTEKLVKTTERMLEVVLHDDNSGRSIAFQQTIEGTTDAILDATNACNEICYMYKYGRKSDKSEVTDEEGRAQLSLCKAKHEQLLDQARMMKAMTSAKT